MTVNFHDEFLLGVAQDLEYLAEKWGNQVDDDTLRRDCVVLRRLLLQDNLGKAWREVGFKKQPRVEAPMLEIIGDKKRVSFAQAGGANYGGIEVRDSQIYIDDKLPSEYAQKTPDAIYKGQGMEARLYVSKEPSQKLASKALWLSVFLAATCIIANGTEISRRDLILYVANTLGGAHVDWDREFKEQPKMQAKFRALDAQYKTGTTANKESIYYELLSIGQNLADSEDIQELKACIRNL